MRHYLQNTKFFILYLLSFIFFFTGCMVGPNYRPPVEVLPEVYSEDRLVETEAIADEDLAHWWTFFNDPFLNELLAESLRGSFDWRIALERVCQTRAAYWVSVTDALPEIDSDLQVTRSRTSQTFESTSLIKIPPIQTFYQAGLDAIWQIDLFGGLRRAARAAYDTWEATVEDARGVRIVLLAEVAITYTNICAFQQTVNVAMQTIRLDEDLLALSLDRFQAGLTDEQEVDAAAATLEADRAALTILETNLRQAIYSLATLVGRPPESFLEQFMVARSIPYANGKVPLGLPSDLLRRRPDIRSAERQIAAATEQIGVAVASLFPQISLTGSSASFSSNPLQGANYGYASNSFTKWFTAPSRIWGIGGVVSLPLFDFGKRLATVDEQISFEHQALLTYEKTVIAALQEVESDLVAYFNEEERLNDLSREAAADRRSLDLVADLFQAGLADLSQVLAAEEIWLTAVSNQIASSQALTNNLITLYKALGGGWECSYTP